MSDPNDPFSAQPYIPPSERGPDTPEDAPKRRGPPLRRRRPRTSLAAPAEPPSPEPDVRSDVEPTVPVQDVESHDWPPHPTAQDAGSTHEMPAVATADVPADDREPTVVLPTESERRRRHASWGGRRRVAGLTALLVLAAGAGVGGAAAYDALRGDGGTAS